MMQAFPKAEPDFANMLFNLLECVGQAAGPPLFCAGLLWLLCLFAGGSVCYSAAGLIDV